MRDYKGYLIFAAQIVFIGMTQTAKKLMSLDMVDAFDIQKTLRNIAGKFAENIQALKQ